MKRALAALLLVALFGTAAAQVPQEGPPKADTQGGSAEPARPEQGQGTTEPPQQKSSSAKGSGGSSGERFQSFKIIPAGSKVYVAPIVGGFDTFIIAGLQKKKVPLVIVTDRSKAEYEITGISETEKAGWAKMLFLGSQASNEQASIKMTDLATGEVVFAYSVHKANSVRGKQSAGESCAKHLKKQIE